MKRLIAGVMLGCMLLFGCSAKDSARIDTGLAVAGGVIEIMEIIDPPEKTVELK